MNKTLIRRLLFELFDTLIHIETHIDGLDALTTQKGAGFVDMVRSETVKCKVTLMSFRQEFLTLFQEEPLDETFVTRFQEEIYPTVQGHLHQIARALYCFDKGQLPDESELFLNSLNLKRLFPETDMPVVVLTQDETDETAFFDTESALVERLPFLARRNPLQWVSLLNNFSQRFTAETLQIKTFVEELKLPNLQLDLISPLINLRLFGPSYYSYYIINALQAHHTDTLCIVESLLFHGLNHFGFINKDLVILHQGIERSKEAFCPKEYDKLAKLLQEEEVRNQLLHLVEKVVPERLAFTEKSLARAQLLEERLAQGVLISAVPMLASPAQITESLSQLGETETIEPLLGQIQESAATPVEIINAGWIHKLDRTSAWLKSLLEDESGEDAAWQRMKQTIVNLDELILKSIEISEVHRVLAQQAVEPPITT